MNLSKGVYHCFGCGANGDVIKFEMEYEKKDFRDALASLNGSPLSTSVKKPKTNEITTEPLAPTSEKEALELLDHYHQTLLNNSAAQDYLGKRGLNHPDIISHFRIGYADRSASKLLGRSPKHSKDPKREELRAWGFLRENGYEHFTGCLTIPIFQKDGSLGEVYGRRTNRTKPNVSPHLYLPGPHKGVFNLAGLHSQEPLLICEAIIDALTFWCHGFQNVTASFGAKGITEEMIQAFQKKGMRQVYIAYDGDEGGRNAADDLGRHLVELGFEVYRVLLPAGDDVNSFALKQEDPKQSLTDLLSTSQQYLPPDPVPDVAPPTLPMAAMPEGTPPLTNSTMATKIQIPALPPPTSSPPSDDEKPLEISDLDCQWNGADQLMMVIQSRQYRIRNLEGIRSLANLKVQIKITIGPLFFLDTLDLTSAKQRHQFLVAASQELETKLDILKRDLGRVLIGVERIAEYRIAQQEKAKQKDTQPDPMTQEEQEEALAFLKQQNLLDQILEDFDIIGLVGEHTNKLVGYIAATSRKLSDPMAVLVQSSSSAGKTTLMDAILSLIPREDKEKWTTVTSKALYYFEEEQLAHKILAVAEEEGMERATYPLKILQSEKELKIATTVKDPKTGEFKVQTKVVNGPCAIILTTTSVDIDEELANRFIRLTVNEDREQTLAIHQKQRQARTLSGRQKKVIAEVIKRKHHNAQRLLKPVTVFNPYADQLTFNSDHLRSRRDHEKYLGLIDAIAFLHQMQRPHFTAEINGRQVEYVEATTEDIRHANRLITEVLGRCLDELAPQTRRLLKLIHQMVVELAEKNEVDRDQVHFTRKRVREYCKWSDSQLKTHMKRLADLEYLLVQEGGRGQVMVYELLWDGQGELGEKFIPGVVDVDTLKPIR